MFELVRRSARHFLRAGFTGLRALGALGWIADSDWRRGRLLILCYHGVSLQDEHEWNPELFMAPGFLRRRFEIIRDGGYRVLPLAEAVRCLRQGTLPARSVVLTFDDGFHNFYSAAVPLLEEFEYPATNYMSSYHCVHQTPILGLSLRYVLWRARRRALPPGMLPGQNGSVELSDARQRGDLAKSLFNEAQSYANDRDAQYAWLGEIATRLGVDWGAVVGGRLFHLMTGAEVADVARRGFDIQLHTHRHRTPRERAVFLEEVRENRRILEEFTGHPTMHFCYPSGDVDPLFLPWLRELNVETATTTVPDLARPGDDPLLLPRFVDTMAQPEVMFEGWLSGARSILKRLSA